jgi:hypothetical protein
MSRVSIPVRDPLTLNAGVRSSNVSNGIGDFSFLSGGRARLGPRLGPDAGGRASDGDIDGDVVGNGSIAPAPVGGGGAPEGTYGGGACNTTLDSENEYPYPLDISSDEE